MSTAAAISPSSGRRPNISDGQATSPASIGMVSDGALT
jgi:hypothetical protein